jgi:hypothetical protein
VVGLTELSEQEKKEAQEWRTNKYKDKTKMSRAIYSMFVEADKLDELKCIIIHKTAQQLKTEEDKIEMFDFVHKNLARNNVEFILNEIKKRWGVEL